MSQEQLADDPNNTDQSRTRHAVRKRVIDLVIREVARAEEVPLHFMSKKAKKHNTRPYKNARLIVYWICNRSLRMPLNTLGQYLGRAPTTIWAGLSLMETKRPGLVDTAQNILDHLREEHPFLQEDRTLNFLRSSQARHAPMAPAHTLQGKLMRYMEYRGQETSAIMRRAGVSANTMTRLKQGKNPSLFHFQCVCEAAGLDLVLIDKKTGRKL